LKRGGLKASRRGEAEDREHAEIFQQGSQNAYTRQTGE
jgi:hypothetical protein